MSNVAKVVCRWSQLGLRNITLNEDFIKSRNEDSDIGYFIEADVQYPEKLLEKTKIKKVVKSFKTSKTCR